MYTLYIIIAILITEFIVNLILDYLNLKHELKPVDQLIANKFSFLRRKKMQLYHSANYKISKLNTLASLLIILTLLTFSGFGYIDTYVHEIFENQILITLFFFAILGFLAFIISIPWDIYNTFYIEKRFGFNNQTFGLFILDKMKGLFLSIIIGGSLLALVTWIYYQFPNQFWWFAWCIITVFSLLMTMFYSNLIVPLFNKQTPLEQGELRNKIEEMAHKADFKLDNIFVIDGSKRSTKSNAYFTGLGPQKRIVLYDTLINDLSPNEIIAVLAHEIGHYKKRHILINFISGVLQTGFILFLFDFIAGYNEIYNVIGTTQPSLHIALLVFGFLFTPISIILEIVTNFFSRQAEFQADTFASKMGKGADLKTALIKLSDKNLSNINPHTAYVFVHYSHPPMVQRLKNINKIT